MISAAHQLQYLPYIGFFNKMMQSDVFILVDNVQFNKKEVQNRNRIRTKDNWIWLTVPVLVKGKLLQNINEVAINNKEDWQKKHLRSILINYSKAPYMNHYRDKITEIYTTKWEKLIDLNFHILKFLIDELKIKTKIIVGSDIGVSGKKTDLLLDICQKTGADTYLSGPGGRNYVDVKRLNERGIKHFFQDFHHPVYKQFQGDFIPRMCILDILLNEGPEKSRDIIMSSGGKSEI